MTYLLIACALLLFLTAGLLLWMLHYYHKARRLLSPHHHSKLNREYLQRKQRELGIVARKSSTTDTTKVIKPRKGAGYPGDK